MPHPALWIDPTELLRTPSAERPVACDPALDHAAFVARSLGLAGGLAARGARRAALWFDDAAELAAALLACWRAGVVAVIPNDVLPPTCALVDADVDLWLTDTDLPLPAGRTHAPQALMDAPPLAAGMLDEAAAGLVLYTSGSSGRPKQIRKSWQQLASEVRTLATRWPADEALCVLGSVGAHHMFGLPFRVLWPLCAGHAIDRRQRHYPEELERTSLAHERFVWIASPALLRRVGERIDWAGLCGRLRALYTAGSPLPAAISDHIASACGCRPTEIYGSTETGIVATRQGAGAWQLFDGVEAGTDAAGALWVASPWTAGAREQTADAAELGPQGLHLLGRLDRVVKLEEKRIGLPTVEAALEAHPYVAEARVGLSAGTPRLAALLGLSAGGLHALRNGGRRALIGALRRHLAGRVEPLAIPRVWRLLRQIPWNAQGKLNQQQFAALAGPRPRQPQFEAPVALEDGSWQTAFEVPPDLAFFSGHFPATPVVPGVAQIGWALQVARAHIRPELRVGGIENLKFQRLMRPGDRATLTLRWDAARAKLSFVYRLADEPCSSGRIVHAHEHAAP
ncbi:AMP-binding protein [Pseudothauera rhizosphaerae]|uniref:AMP-binding protein n=1 Tax=Pseudothauera rhizosphaerae TaxID=2565932 RepID=A0A4S4ARU1_9RHOO|nr:AMP-binding protein [Pseudothauera rhizosphaerae]THF62502.1 AMP-binding protein [Pseudothauera rhizosphaerae]